MIRLAVKGDADVVRQAWDSLAPAARLRVLLWTVGLGGTAALLYAALTPSEEPTNWTFVAVVVAVTLCSDAPAIGLRFRHQVESYTWSELAVLLGLALLAPQQQILTALCVALTYVLTLRSPAKIVYNAASYAIGVTLATIVTRSIIDPTPDEPIRSGIALALGAMAFSWWNGVSISAAIALSQDLPFRQVQSRGLRIRMLISAGNVALGLGVLVLPQQGVIGWLAVPAMAIVLYAAYRNYLRTVQDRHLWRQLEESSKEIGRLEETAIAEVAVSRAAELLDADAVELCVWVQPGEDGIARPAHVYAGAGAGVDATHRRWESHHNEFTITTYRTQSESRLGGTSEETCVQVPLIGQDEQVGILRIRFFAKVKLTRAEVQLVKTFGHTISASLQNARLYAAMRDQAARSEIASLHDALTGLPNRLLLEQRTNEALAHAGPEHQVALLLLDLDHFKQVNDTLGHGAGDTLLREVGARLRAAVRAHDTVCRLGGDEFAILLVDGSVAETTAQRMLDVLRVPIELDGVRLAVEGSIGVACYPQDGATYDELLARADVAMYDAKAVRASYRRYRSDRDGSSLTRLSLAVELRAALDDDQLVLHYQPQFDLATGVPVGAEALVRWNHPTRGLLGPDEFVPTVETCGLVRDFTLQVLDRAVAECARWQRAGADLTIAVNLSARNVEDVRLPADVAATLQRHGLAADRLVLEITETAIPADLDVAEQLLARLQATGVAVSIDDFGTGHSSLAFLHRVAVDEVKVDRQFVATMLAGGTGAAITKATIQLGQSLGLRTVAEGVTDLAVLDRLIDLRCDAAQGFHWSPAVPAIQARSLLGVTGVCADPGGVTVEFTSPRVGLERRTARAG